MDASLIRGHSAGNDACELVTILDFVRFAATRFVEAEVVLGHGTSDPIGEALFLVCEALHLPVDHTESFLPARLTARERRLVLGLIETRIQTRRPSAYILNRAYIRHMSFFVDERVIVPRSLIGELLADDAFTGAPFSLIPDPAAIMSILDLCTGSGCLAIIAAEVFGNAVIDAVDLSQDALDVAQINVSNHGLKDRIRLLRGDLFEPVVDACYDLILANPPYVDSGAMAALPPEYRYEPALALDGGEDGLQIVRRILAGTERHLKDGGGLLCEVGRTRQALEREYSSEALIWLDTEETSGEVFWLGARSTATTPRSVARVDVTRVR